MLRVGETFSKSCSRLHSTCLLKMGCKTSELFPARKCCVCREHSTWLISIDFQADSDKCYLILAIYVRQYKKTRGYAYYSKSVTLDFGVRFWTHNILSSSLFPLPLDQGSIARKNGLKAYHSIIIELAPSRTKFS